MNDTGFKLDFTYYDEIPEHTRMALVRYVEKRLPPGGFLFAVLTNDLRGAVEYSDQYNRPVIPNIVTFLFNRVPIACWGDKESVEMWINGE